MEYPKINSLWKRKTYKEGMPKGSHGDLIIGDYAEEAFGTVKYWDVDEKVDGTNVRIYYSNSNGPSIEFKGRTNDAILPPHLLSCLASHFTRHLLDSIFHEENQSIILFGEGYGPKIQACGGNYRSDAGFILFDVYANGWWLQRKDVENIASQLEAPVTPFIGRMTEEEVIDFVKSKPISRCSRVPHMMEGVIARSSPLLLFRDGKPVKFKLKCKEFI